MRQHTSYIPRPDGNLADGLIRSLLMMLIVTRLKMVFMEMRFLFKQTTPAAVPEDALF